MYQCVQQRKDHYQQLQNVQDEELFASLNTKINNGESLADVKKYVDELLKKQEEGDEISDQAALSKKLRLEKESREREEDRKKLNGTARPMASVNAGSWLQMQCASPIAMQGQTYQRQGDYDKANKCFLKAAKQGDSSSLFNLGVNYDAGHGVNQDAVQAADFYQLAANVGDPLSMCNLGSKYYQGTGGRSYSLYMARFWWQQGSALLEENCVANVRDLNVLEKRDTDYVQVFDKDIRSCTFCRLPEIENGSKLKKCACRGAAYCNSKCQKLHWKWGGHKKIHRDNETRKKE